jgi:hypothetical protein
MTVVGQFEFSPLLNTCVTVALWQHGKKEGKEKDSQKEVCAET